MHKLEVQFRIHGDLNAVLLHMKTSAV